MATKTAEVRVEGRVVRTVEYEPFEGRRIVKGDRVRITTSYAIREGTVGSASRFFDGVYYIELSDVACYWKQDEDGGKVELI